MGEPLPDPYVGGPQADEVLDARALQERLDGIQRNFDHIKDRMPQTGDVSIRLRGGTVDVSLAAAATNTATVNHGMGSTPVAVTASPDDDNYAVETHTFTDTQFTVGIRHTAGTALTDTITVGWIAFG